jgi:hypothetical protein
LLGHASSLSNGTVEFTGINDADSYYLMLDGYSNPLSGISYGFLNRTMGSFTPSSSVYITTQGGLRSYTSSTAKVVGTPIPVTSLASSGVNNWVITQNTTVCNGTVVLGSKIYFGNPHLSVTFKNVDLINKFTGGFEGYAGNFTLINSTFFSMPYQYGNVILGNNAPTNVSILNSIIYSSSFDVTGRMSISHSHLYETIFANPTTNKNTTISCSYLNAVVSIDSSSFDLINASFIINSIFATINLNNSYLTGTSSAVGIITNVNHDTISNMVKGYEFNNMSYSMVTDFPETTLNPPTYNMGVNYMYNDWIDFNYSTADFCSLKTPEMSISENNNQLYVNHSLFYYDGVLHFGLAHNASFSHDMFTHYALIQAEGTGFQSFTSNSKTVYSYTNNTFGTVCYNQTIMEKVSSSPGYYPGVGGLYGDMNVNNPSFPLGYVNLTHNTFQSVMLGNGPFAGQTAPTDVLLGEGNVQANVSENLFMNDYKYDYGPNATTIIPYTWDIVDWAGYNYIYNNVFENLNNQIIPIGSNNNESGLQGYGSITGGHSTNHIGGNLFYYHPSPIESYVPLGNMTASEDSAQVGQIAYQMPTFYNDSVSFSSSPQYISNTSVQVYDSYQSTKVWIYNITPDVSISSGNPVISYSNGLVGGPQPNFIWKGYDYSESVEPSYIQVGVNSSKAPSIGLQFQGIAGALYDIEMFNNGSLISSYQETATSSGVLNATYNPATMPLDPIFYVEYVGSGVTPPPVVPPLVPIVPHVLFGIPYLNVIVLFGGIALASEEFFRTQTKGKEKKYSYTGIFVGIMIAGIGLMSVL